MGALRRAWTAAGEPVAAAAGEPVAMNTTAAAGGTCRLVLLAGEAGVGKTRLAAELAGEVDAAGAAVLVGRCPVGAAQPFHPLVEALGQLPTGDRDRSAMLRSVAASLAARARRAPVLLVLDDLHRADRSTLLAVRRIAEVPTDGHLLVVGTYRDSGLDRSHPLTELLAAVLPRADVTRIHVGGLAPEAIAEMVGDAELGRRLWRLSAGNAVWATELLQPGMLDRGPAHRFDELIAARVAGLRRPARELLAAAAVAGPEFDADVVAEAARVSAGRVAPALHELTAAGFILAEPAGAGHEHRFVHDMVREAVDRGLDAMVRVQLHERVGQALERRHAAPAAVLSWHFRAAAPVGRSLRAMAHAVRAGDRALELLAWDEAAGHYGNALAAANGVAPQVRADLLLSIGEAQRLAGEASRARQAFLEAAGLARSCGDGARMARAALALGQVAAVWGADPELEAVAAEARSLLGPVSAPIEPAASPFTDFASDALYDVLDGVERPAPVVPAAAPAGRPVDVALLRARHVAMAGPEHVTDRLVAAGELIAAAGGGRGEHAGAGGELAASARAWHLVDALQLGRVEEALADQAAHAEISRALGTPRHGADVAAWSAMRALLEGRPEDARWASAESFRLAVEAGDPEADTAFLTQRWWLALEWGSDDELAAIAEECRVRASGPVDPKAWRAALALTLTRAGRLDLAAEELRRVTDHGLGELVRSPGRLSPLASLAEVAWTVGDGPRAAAIGAMLEPFAEQLVVVGRARACQGSVARACGMAAASAHRWDEAERHFRSALAVHRAIGALPLVARTRHEWSLALRDRGRAVDRRRARDSRRKAAELAARLGMSRLLAETGGRPR